MRNAREQSYLNKKQVYGELHDKRLEEESRSHVGGDAKGDGDGQCWQRLVHEAQQHQGQDEPRDDGKVAHESRHHVVHRRAPNQHAVEDEVSQAKLD